MLLKTITFCKYQLQVSNKNIILSFPQLLDLRNNINRYCIHHHLEDVINNQNFVLLFIADRQHLVYLDIPTLINLKSEIDAIFAPTLVLV